MTSQIIVIIFSKDRALQLDACLASLRLQCHDASNHKTRVIFKCSNSDSRRQYETLKSEHPEVHFMEEGIFCRDLINAVEGSTFVLFLVDDNLFVRPFSLEKTCSLLADHRDAIGFSLRLGRNITSCYSFGDAPQGIPLAEKAGEESLKFRWIEGEYDFGYPLEVSSSVFRTKEVLPLFVEGGDSIKNPNALEAYIHSQIKTFTDSHPFLLCLEQSVAFCNPVNMVQSLLPNRSGQEASMSVPVLMERFDLGFRVDVATFQNYIPRAPHAEVSFSYTRPILPWKTLMAELKLSGQGSPSSNDGSLLIFNGESNLATVDDGKLYALARLWNDIKSLDHTSSHWFTEFAVRLMESRQSHSDAVQAPLKEQVSLYRRKLDAEAKKATETAHSVAETISTYEKLRKEAQEWTRILQSSVDASMAQIRHLEGEINEYKKLVQAFAESEKISQEKEETAKSTIDRLERSLSKASDFAETSKAQAKKANAQARELRNEIEYTRGRWWYRAFSWINRISVFLKSIYRPKVVTSDSKFKVEDSFVNSDGKICLRGWHFLKKKKHSRVRVEIRSWAKVRSSTALVVCRKDLAKKYPTRPAAENSGFEVQTPLYRGWNTVALQHRSGRKWITFASYRLYGPRSLGKKSDDLSKDNVVEGERWSIEKPLVTIVVGTDFLNHPSAKHALNSIRLQTWTDFEVVAVGVEIDSSLTNSLGSLKDKFVWLECYRQISTSAMWNLGGQKAKGKYLCFPEPGLELAHTYLEKAVFELETGGHDVCIAHYRTPSGSEHRVTTESFGLNYLAEAAPHSKGELIEQSFWNKVGGVDESLANVTTLWWDFWVKSARLRPSLFVIPEFLIHPNEPLKEVDEHASKSRKEILKRHRMLGFLRATEVDLVLNKRRVMDPWVNLLRHTGTTKSKNPSLLVCLPHTVVGGSERLISQISQGLVKQGFRINVITTHVPEPSQGDSTSWFESITSGIYHFPRFLSADEWKGFFLHLLHHHQVDIVWIAGSQFTYDLLPEIKTAFPRIKVIDFLFNEVGHTASNRRYDYCIDLTVSENESVRTWLLANGESNDRTMVIPSGVNLLDHKPIEKRPLPFPSQNRTLVVGYFGRLSVEKGPEMFVKIAASFKTEPRTQFILAGDGPMRQELQRLIQSEGITDTLHFVGFGHIEELLPCCDLVVVPSHLDGRPILVMEASAAGIPVIASRVGGLGDMMADGKSGFLCRSGNITDFTEKIQTLLQDAELLQFMKRNARCFAEEHFDMNKTILKFAEVFQNLAEK